jgi:hypothetical protein
MCNAVMTTPPRGGGFLHHSASELGQAHPSSRGGGPQSMKLVETLHAGTPASVGPAPRPSTRGPGSPRRQFLRTRCAAVRVRVGRAGWWGSTFETFSEGASLTRQTGRRRPARRRHGRSVRAALVVSRERENGRNAIGVHRAGRLVRARLLWIGAGRVPPSELVPHRTAAPTRCAAGSAARSSRRR